MNRRLILFVGILAAGAACGDRSAPAPAPPEDAPGSAADTGVAAGSAAPTAAVDYSTPIVLFVHPDSAEIDRLRRAMGEDFYIVADDAMWYRAAAYELLDSLGIPHAEVGRGSARFLVDGRPRDVGWKDVDRSWFAIVYDGRAAPAIVSDIDMGEAVSGDVRRARSERGVSVPAA